VRAIDATGDRQPAFWPPGDEAFETAQADLQHPFPAIAGFSRAEARASLGGSAQRHSQRATRSIRDCALMVLQYLFTEYCAYTAIRLDHDLRYIYLHSIGTDRSSLRLLSPMGTAVSKPNSAMASLFQAVDIYTDATLCTSGVPVAGRAEGMS